MNGYLGPKPLVLNSWWGHFVGPPLEIPCLAGSLAGPRPVLKTLHCNELHLNETLLNASAFSPLGCQLQSGVHR